MRRLFKRASLYIIVLIILAGIHVVSIVASLNNEVYIYPSVTVGEIEIGDLSIDDAKALLEKSAPTSLFISFEDKSWEIDLKKDINLVFDPLQTAHNAYLQPRQGNLLQRFLALHMHHQIQPILTLDEKKLSVLIDSYERKVYRPAKPASIQHNSENDEFIIKPEILGYELNNSLHSLREAIFSLQSTVSLTSREVKPTITSQDLEHITSVLAEYRTTFNSKEIARTHNIILAAKDLDAKLLHPGEILSFNQLVGSRTEQRGYRKAPTYVNGGKLVDDWGGGICQVSSTLYNAALLADLTIIERSPHFRPPEYVPIGLDATVDFDSKLDLKIKNSLPQSVYFSVEVQGTELIIKILGKPLPDKPAIRIITSELTTIEPHTEYIQDENLNPGIRKVTQIGHSGFRVSTTKIRSINGHEITRELLSEDIYNPINRIVYVGAKTEDESK